MQRALGWGGLVFAVALAIRLGAYAVAHLALFDRPLHHPDSVYYHTKALWIIEHPACFRVLPGPVSKDCPSTSDLDHVVLLQLGGYIKFVSIFYRIFGPNYRIPELFNAFLGACLAWVCYKLGVRLFGPEGGKWAGFLLAVDPALVYYSTQLLKDTLLLVLFVLSLLVARLEWAGYAKFPLLAGLVTIAGSIRPQVGFLACMIILADILFRARRDRALLFCLILSPVLYFFGKVTWGSQLVTLLSVDKLNELRVATDFQGHLPFFAASLPKELFDSFLDVGLFILRAPVYVLLAPFPWHARTGYERLFVIHILWWYAMVPLGLWGIVRSWQDPFSRVLTIFSGMAGMVLALLITGTAAFFRWRFPIHVVLLIFAGRGVAALLERNAGRAGRQWLVRR